MTRDETSSSMVKVKPRAASSRRGHPRGARKPRSASTGAKPGGAKKPRARKPAAKKRSAAAASSTKIVKKPKRKKRKGMKEAEWHEHVGAFSHPRGVTPKATLSESLS